MVGLLGGLIPIIIYNAVSYLTIGSLPVSVYFTPKPTDFYGSGGWLHYGMPLLNGLGKPVALLAILGIPSMLRSPRATLFLAWNLVYVVMHVVIFRFGLFASAGFGGLGDSQRDRGRVCGHVPRVGRLSRRGESPALRPGHTSWGRPTFHVARWMTGLTNTSSLPMAACQCWVISMGRPGFACAAASSMPACVASACATI